VTPSVCVSVSCTAAAVPPSVNPPPLLPPSLPVCFLFSLPFTPTYTPTLVTASYIILPNILFIPFPYTQTLVVLVLPNARLPIYRRPPTSHCCTAHVPYVGLVGMVLNTGLNTPAPHPLLYTASPPSLRWRHLVRSHACTAFSATATFLRTLRTACAYQALPRFTCLRWCVLLPARTTTRCRAAAAPTPATFTTAFPPCYPTSITTHCPVSFYPTPHRYTRTPVPTGLPMPYCQLFIPIFTRPSWIAVAVPHTTPVLDHDTATVVRRRHDSQPTLPFSLFPALPVHLPHALHAHTAAPPFLPYLPSLLRRMDAPPTTHHHIPPPPPTPLPPPSWVNILFYLPLPTPLPADTPPPPHTTHTHFTLPSRTSRYFTPSSPGTATSPMPACLPQTPCCLGLWICFFNSTGCRHETGSVGYHSPPASPPYMPLTAHCTHTCTAPACTHPHTPPHMPPTAFCLPLGLPHLPHTLWTIM